MDDAQRTMHDDGRQPHSNRSPKWRSWPNKIPWKLRNLRAIDVEHEERATCLRGRVSVNQNIRKFCFRFFSKYTEIVHDWQINTDRR